MNTDTPRRTRVFYRLVLGTLFVFYCVAAGELSLGLALVLTVFLDPHTTLGHYLPAAVTMTVAVAAGWAGPYLTRRLDVKRVVREVVNPNKQPARP